MPFVGTQRVWDLEARKIMPDKIGDLCALAYKPMVEKWKANKSWTTWSRIRKEAYNGAWKIVHLDSRKETWIGLFNDEDAQNQVEAAADVFYDRYVSHYESEKYRDNGGVTGDRD